MARINIEDSIMEKAGFQKLMIKMGDRHKAMGVVWDLWRLAQKYWFPEKKLIPFKAFEEADLPECLFDNSIGLAEKRPDGIYAKGSEDQFAWLFQRKAAGQASAKAKRDAKELQTEIDQTTVEQPSTEVQQPSTTVEQSPTARNLFTLSSSLSSQDSLNTNCAELEKTPVPAPPNIFDNISEKLKSSWLRLYGDQAWIDFEVNKAQCWIIANPHKAPKSRFSRFLNNWLSNGWEKHRITIPAKKRRFSPPPEPDTPDPRNGPLKPEIQNLLNVARGIRS